MHVLAPPQHGRASLVEDDVLVRVRELLGGKRLDVRDEHASAADPRDIHGVEDVAGRLSCAAAGGVLAVHVREYGVARVTANREHACPLQGYVRARTAEVAF